MVFLVDREWVEHITKATDKKSLGHRAIIIHISHVTILVSTLPGKADTYPGDLRGPMEEDRM